jgi:hypothetical protein
MGRKPKIQCRIERDTDEAIQRYCDDLDGDVSQSEAVRHLLRAGLAAKGHPVAATDGGDDFLERLASERTAASGAVCTFLSGVSLIGAGELAQLGGFYGALLLLFASVTFLIAAAGLIGVAALAQLALARPLRALVFPWGETA